MHKGKRKDIDVANGKGERKRRGKTRVRRRRVVGMRKGKGLREEKENIRYPALD